MPRVVVHVGHVLDVLRRLPEASVHCIITSPPYYGLREYGLPPQVWGGAPDCAHAWRTKLLPAGNGMTDSFMRGPSLNRASATRRAHASALCAHCGAWRGSLGLEPSPWLYLEHMVQVFRDVRRVLRPDGTLWLNMGDSYASNAAGPRPQSGFPSERDRAHEAICASTAFRNDAIKVKDMLGMPWRLALALQADSWWLRKDVIWAKDNPMPESVADRPTSAHEYLFLLARSERYFYDADAIREPHEWLGNGGRLKTPSGWDTGPGAHQGLVGRYPRTKTSRAPHAGGRRQAPEPGEPDAFHPRGRNKRSVWTIPTVPFELELCVACGTVYEPEAYHRLPALEDEDAPRRRCRCGAHDAWASHFATFPPDLVLPCVLAGTSARGCCPKCGAPWRRLVDRAYDNPGRRATNGPRSLSRRDETAGFPVRLELACWTVGWAPACACPSSEPVPCTVLDPFCGSGTALVVAAKNGRDAIGVDLQRQYVPFIQHRLRALELDLVYPTTLDVRWDAIATARVASGAPTAPAGGRPVAAPEEVRPGRGPRQTSERT